MRRLSITIEWGRDEPEPPEHQPLDATVERDPPEHPIGFTPPNDPMRRGDRDD